MSDLVSAIDSATTEDLDALDAEIEQQKARLKALESARKIVAAKLNLPAEGHQAVRKLRKQTESWKTAPKDWEKDEAARDLFRVLQAHGGSLEKGQARDEAGLSGQKLGRLISDCPWFEAIADNGSVFVRLAQHG